MHLKLMFKDIAVYGVSILKINFLAEVGLTHLKSPPHHSQCYQVCLMTRARLPFQIWDLQWEDSPQFLLLFIQSFP